MSRVLISESTGAAVHVFSDDHCPPHIHARHRGDGWIARVEFSYVDSAVRLMSIAPSRNIPVQRVVNRLLDDIRAGLPACRRGWWATTRMTCLANRYAVVLAPTRIELVPGRLANAKRISDAVYDPDQQRLRVTFRDGATMEMSTPT